MSEFSFESRAAADTTEILPEGVIVETCPAAPTLFEPDSEEADALRGALSFLYALMTTYDEMLEAAPAEGDATSGQSSP
jgi:hypothetical protein